MQKRAAKKAGISSNNARCKALRDQCLTTITTELELLRANNEGKVPYGAITWIVAEYKDSFPWLNKDLVKNHLRKLNKQDDGNKNTSTSTIKEKEKEEGSVCNLNSHSTLTLTNSLTESEGASSAAIIDPQLDSQSVVVHASPSAPSDLVLGAASVLGATSQNERPSSFAAVHASPLVP
jgi:hypothetical protein